MLTPKFLGPADGTRLFVPGGDQSTTKLAAADTADQFSLATYTVQPRTGTPLHVHAREDETFYILDGVIEFWIGPRDTGTRITAPAGSTFFGPRGVPHCFRNCSALPASMLLIVSPASNFEAFYQQIGGPGPDGAPPSEGESIRRVVTHAPEHGIQILGPSPLE